MSQCPRLLAAGEGYRFRHRDHGLDINMHQKRADRPHKGSPLASTQARLGRLVVHLGHTALRDRVDLVLREETRGQQEVEEEVQEDTLHPRDQEQVQVEDPADPRRPHRRHRLVERTQIGEKCSATNSSA